MGPLSGFDYDRIGVPQECDWVEENDAEDDGVHKYGIEVDLVLNDDRFSWVRHQERFGVLIQTAILATY